MKRIRNYRISDIPQIASLYYETVHRVNAKDYTEDQIAAWAPRVYEDSFWRRRFGKYKVYVAEENGLVVGFAEFERTGHIDCFYVHHGWQSRGIGHGLMKKIERQAASLKLSRLFADVSITAMPFFRKMGFAMLRRQKKIYRGRVFRQYYMEKIIR